MCCGGGTEIEQFINNHERIIVKPTGLSSGKGIHVYCGESAESLIESGALIEEFVVQSKEMSRLNPTSVNTVRIYTMLDRESEPHVLTASLRVGGCGSEVDNYHAGGVGYPIDVDSGTIMSPGADIMGIRHLYHPGTNEKVIGFEIPRWKQLLDFVFSACKVVKTARLIAWDVAVLEDGFELIEGNYQGDPGFMQTPSNQGMLYKIKELI